MGWDQVKSSAPSLCKMEAIGIESAGSGSIQEGDAMTLVPVRERGQALVEFGLILVLIIIIVVAVVAALGPQLSSILNSVLRR